jgi:hypothetical protein
MTLAISTEHAKRLERKQQEIDQLGIAARAAMDLYRQFKDAAEGCASRIDGITAEVRQLHEITAQRMCAGNPLDMDAIKRLEATKRDLLSELPVRRRAAEIAEHKYTEVHHALNETRAEHMRIANAAARRAILAVQMDGWQGGR